MNTIHINPLDQLLSRLSGVKRVGSNIDRYSARCPAHDDRRSSLSVKEGQDGRALMYCHAGCSLDSVLAALGMHRRDLFPSKWSLPSDTAKGANNGEVTGRADKSDSRKSEIAATYDYYDSKGRLLYQAVRLAPKEFRQRRPGPDTPGTWIWNLKGVQAVLYRLPELLSADPEAPVYLCEGEKDVDRLRDGGLVATTAPMGAGKWRPGYSEFLRGRNVVILPDNDTPGERHALQAASALLGIAANVRILRLPDLPAHGDVSDWLDAGHGTVDLERLAAGAPMVTRETISEQATGGTAPQEQGSQETNPEGAAPEGRGHVSQSTRMVSLVLDPANHCELFHTPLGEAYASFQVDARKETWPLRSKAARHRLACMLRMKVDKTPGGQAVQDAINELEGHALFNCPERPVYVRVAHWDGGGPGGVGEGANDGPGDGPAIYLDLGNERWQVVKITAKGWEVVDRAPVAFRRAKGMMPLPLPERGGSLDGLRRFVNVQSEADWILLRAFLVACFSKGPYPIMPLQAEQGSAKSNTARIIKSLIDPNVAMLRAEPRKLRDLMISARNSWLIAYDNLSYLSSDVSDALCRLSTGGGFSTRELFTDDGEVLFEAMRPVVLTGIEELAKRSDLLDRALLLSLPPIPEDRRRSESEMWREFELERPRILGGLLDAVSCALRYLPHVRLNVLPRMADFAVWSTAAEPALELAPGSFLGAYLGNRDYANSQALEASPVAEKLQQFMEKQPGGEWRGTASELLQEVSDFATEEERRQKWWPKQANALSNQLRRVAPNLRRCGIDISLGTREGGTGRRIITISKVEPQTLVTFSSAIGANGSVGTSPASGGNPDDSGPRDDAPDCVAASNLTYDGECADFNESITFTGEDAPYEDIEIEF